MKDLGAVRSSATGSFFLPFFLVGCVLFSGRVIAFVSSEALTLDKDCVSREDQITEKAATSAWLVYQCAGWCFWRSCKDCYSTD